MTHRKRSTKRTQKYWRNKKKNNYLPVCACIRNGSTNKTKRSTKKRWKKKYVFKQKCCIRRMNAQISMVTWWWLYIFQMVVFSFASLSHSHTHRVNEQTMKMAINITIPLIELKKSRLICGKFQNVHTHTQSQAHRANWLSFSVYSLKWCVFFSSSLFRSVTADSVMKLLKIHHFYSNNV